VEIYFLSLDNMSPEEREAAYNDPHFLLHMHPSIDLERNGLLIYWTSSEPIKNAVPQYADRLTLEKK